MSAAGIFRRGLLAASLVAGSAAVSGAAVWKAEVQLGMADIYAEMNDDADPAVVLIRVENHSKTESVSVSRYFVQMTDGQNRPVRPVTADDLVSERLRKLRRLMPENVREIDALVGEIQADYPQEKIVSVYARLKQFVSQGRPTGWRTHVENWLLGTRSASSRELLTAEDVIEDIGNVSRNYLWPRDVAPDSVYTGTVFFERPLQDPASIFFEMNRKFLGKPMTQVRAKIGGE